MKSDGSTVGNEMYLQSPNCKNKKGYCSLQNYVKIYAYWDDSNLDEDKSAVLIALDRQYWIHSFVLDE